MKISGIYLGTAATLNLGLGFIPSRVRLTNLNDFIQTEWFFNGGAYGSSKAYYGISIAAAGDKAAITSAANGIVPYAGGDVISTKSTTYQVRDDRDARALGATSTTAISTFTVGTVASKAGHFNVDVSSNRVAGPGSSIVIDGVAYNIVDVTCDGSTGGAGDEVTLDALPPLAATGKVYQVSRLNSCLGWLSADVGVVMPKGITIGASNVAHTAYPVLFEAED